MSALLLPALAAGSSGQGALYVDDVFSTYLYTGNGSTQTINNGIDLAGKGGLVWVKSRSAATDHQVFDTERTATYELITNSTAAQVADADTLTAFSSNGFSLGADATTNANTSTYASWAFRKAQKFFDVVTYTGNGVAGRQIAHSLGVQAGFVTVKATSTTGDWNSYHRSATGDLKLNLTDAQTASRAIITAADASTFTVSGAANTNGVIYVAYLWAHDPSAEGIIQCGSFADNSPGSSINVNLGWEAQYVLVKNAGPNVGAYGEWRIYDAMRGMSETGAKVLFPDKSYAEDTNNPILTATSTGFKVSWSGGGNGNTYIYLAIRRPNKPPTSGAQVYNAIARAGTGAEATVTGVGFVPDTLWHSARDDGGMFGKPFQLDRLRGNAVLQSSFASAEYINATQFPTDTFSGGQNVYKLGSANPINSASYNFISWLFRRASGFFDVVCDTGTGAAHAIAHNLTKAPELIIRKSRSAETQWEVWHSALAATEKLVLNSNTAKATDTAAWNSTLPTATQFTVGTGVNVNANAATFVTYLFATLAGISKVGSYTGNGSSQTIDCGFSTGARFFLVKATSTTGSWWVYDSARGIVSAADPALQLNSTAAEITSADAVDPASVGIIVNQEATCSINATGVSYIFLAIA